MKHTLSLFLIIIFSCIAALGQQPANQPDKGSWIDVAPANAEFAVRMPGKPTVKVEPVKGVSGVEHNMFTLETNLAAYVFTYVQYGDPVTDATAIKDLLDKGREGGLQATGGKLKSEKEIRYGSYQGREWIMELPGGLAVTARAYWVNRRLYQLVFVYQPKDDTDEVATVAARNQFFDSFSLRSAN